MHGRDSALDRPPDVETVGRRSATGVGGTGAMNMGATSTEDTGFRWQSAGATHIGTVRSVNEDACLDRPEVGLWVVADGMGGHDAGDVASRMIVESLQQLDRSQSRDDFVDELLSRLQEVNGALVDYAESNAKNVVGSTVVIMIGWGGKCTCIWAGDSRIYLQREGRLRQVTKDHSQVEELVSLGLLDRDEADSHPASNVITRAVGAMDSLAVDMVSHGVRDGDVYLLCSDGLNKVVPDGEISEVLGKGGCREAAEGLIDRALQHGARDNVTAVVVRVEAEPDV